MIKKVIEEIEQGKPHWEIGEEKEIRRGKFVPIYTGGKPIQASEIQRQIEIFEKKKINDSK